MDSVRSVLDISPGEILERIKGKNGNRPYGTLPHLYYTVNTHTIRSRKRKMRFDKAHHHQDS